MSAPKPEDWTYYGGERGEIVEFEPGWPPPNEMSHVEWTGHYKQNREKHRYEWSEEPMP